MLLLIAIQIKLHAQFTDSIHVVFEKKINIHKLFEKDEWMKDNIKNFDKYQVEKYEFIGTVQHSVYRFIPPPEDQPVKRSAIWGYSCNENIVYNNYTDKRATVFKTVYEENMLISDSLKKLKWHISNETRDIAGYKCRKATSVIFDSCVVYAFYAQELVVTGGPETFNGLPGMILGVAIPKMHTSWFAKSVDTVNVKTTEITAPKKGKKNSYQSLYKKVSDALKNWGDEYKNLMTWVYGI